MQVLLSKFETVANDAREQLLPLYSPKLSFHGPNHPENVFQYHMKEIETCIINDIEFSENDIVQSIWADFGHDAGNHLILPSRFIDLEERSAWYTYMAAKKAGYDVLQIAKPASLLVGVTRAKAPCVTPKEKGMRRADVNNVSDEYDIFRTASDNLYEEYLFICARDDKKPLPYDKWFDQIACDKYLIPILRPNLAYGEFDTGLSGKSIFQEKCYVNIDKTRDKLGLPPLTEEQKAA